MIDIYHWITNTNGLVLRRPNSHHYLTGATSPLHWTMNIEGSQEVLLRPNHHLSLLVVTVWWEMTGLWCVEWKKIEVCLRKMIVSVGLMHDLTNHIFVVIRTKFVAAAGTSVSGTMFAWSKSIGLCMKDITPVLMHWSYVFLHKPINVTL